MDRRGWWAITSAGKGCGRQAVTGHDVGAQKGVVSLSREVIFAELGKVDTRKGVLCLSLA